MSYFGGYFGSVETQVLIQPEVPQPVESPYEPVAPEFLEHAQLMINRLPEQFRAKSI